MVKYPQIQRFPVDIVSAEKLIGSLAGKHSIHMLFGLPGYKVQWNSGRICNGNTHVPDYLRHVLSKFFRANNPAYIIQLVKISNFLSQVYLIVPFNIKTCSKGLYAWVYLLCQGSYDR